MAGVAEVEFTTEGAEVVLSGNWKIGEKNAGAEACAREILSKNSVTSAKITAKKLVSWDSSLILFLMKFLKICEAKRLSVDVEKIPIGAQRLMDLVHFGSPEEKLRTSKKNVTLISFLGEFGLRTFAKSRKFARFLGEVFASIVFFFGGRAQFNGKDFAVILQDVGVKALPIVALISFLVGLIISFISILQLAQFGASIYVADLVGIAMMREMGCIMTGVIMSGRTGAAFAATLGTMVANDEIDALQTAGFSPINFLVLPRIFALTSMMLLLCMFASFVGICGGLCAAIFATKLTVSQYCTQVANAVLVKDFLLGLVKGGCFGALISVIGCAKGLFCGKKAEDVGLATTSAVVNSITAIIITDAVFAVLLSSLGI
jgi:phospholipid/cholesterol/gamma-HCH transport system permease protein